MASDLNSIILVGRLTRDIELRFTASGTAIGNFSIATNRRIKKNDDWIDEANFFDVQLWGKTAQGLQKYLIKGQQVAVSGELKQERWEKDGQKHNKILIDAKDVQLLGGKREDAPKDNINRGHVSCIDTPAPDYKNYEDDIPF